MSVRRRVPERWWLRGIGAGSLLSLLLVALLGIVVPIVSPYSISEFAGQPFEGPSLQHPFGSDQFGRDVFTRTFAAAPLDLGLAVLGVSVPFLVGTLVGVLIGTTRFALVDWVWMAVIEGINAFPSLVLMIAIIGAVGVGVPGIIVAIWVTSWARYARIARARASVIRETEFVQAAQLLGYSRARIIARHLIPNAYEETAAYALSDLVIVILGVAGLSFLGLGVRPPTPEWGYMLNEGRAFLDRAWWMSIFPGAILSITAVSVALLSLAAERARARP